MVINLSVLEDNCSMEFDFKENLFFPMQHNLLVKGVLVKCKGNIKKHQDLFYLEGVLNGKFIFQCDKCLFEAQYEMHDFLFSEKVSQNEMPDEDVFHLESLLLDVKAIIFENILLNMPVKVLCKDDCNGLCHICGQNLNLESCKCKKTTHDTRFDVLRSLFNNEEV